MADREKMETIKSPYTNKSMENINSYDKTLTNRNIKLNATSDRNQRPQQKTILTLTTS